MTKTAGIREFIYVDVLKLYSLYSQIFEGVTDRIVEERISQLITGDTQGSFVRQSTAESQGLEASRRVESSILHDHMYNRLEVRLNSALINPDDLNFENLINTYSSNPMIKVSGRAEIEDYQRISIFMEEFNKLGEAIAYSGLVSSDDFKQKKLALQHELEGAIGKARRAELQKQIDLLTNPTKAAEAIGLRQDPKLLENLKFMGELFNPTGYDVLITPHNKPDNHFRGVLDKVWLRNTPQLLSSLYGGQSEAPWTMVGIVTHLPGTYVAQTNKSKGVNNPNEPMMLDAYRNMFRTSRAFERMFLESNTETEIVVSPLAIYREFQVQVKGQD